jgi:hypothetical protein
MWARTDLVPEFFVMCSFIWMLHWWRSDWLFRPRFHTKAKRAPFSPDFARQRKPLMAMLPMKTMGELECSKIFIVQQLATTSWLVIRGYFFLYLHVFSRLNQCQIKGARCISATTFEHPSTMQNVRKCKRSIVYCNHDWMILNAVAGP